MPEDFGIAMDATNLVTGAAVTDAATFQELTREHGDKEPQVVENSWED